MSISSSKPQSFSKFKKNRLKSEFIRLTTEIAESYSNSTANFNYHYYCEHYNISKDCFYKILDYAAIHNFIDDSTFEKMIVKLLSNQHIHVVEATNGQYSTSMTTIEKHRKLKRDRIEFIVHSFTQEEAIAITEELAFSSKEDICKRRKLSPIAFGFIVENVIIKNLVDDTCFNLIKQKSITANNSEKNTSYFNYLEYNRNLYKQYSKELCYIEKSLAEPNDFETTEMLEYRKEQLNNDIKKLFRI